MNSNQESISELENRMSRIEQSLSNLTTMLTGISKGFQTHSSEPENKSRMSEQPVQSTPTMGSNLCNSPARTIPLYNESLDIQGGLQPSTIYDRTSYTSQSRPDGIMVKGYEETCEYINEIRGRFNDDSKVEEIPYIMYPNSAVEKTFMAYYNALAANLNRTPSDESDLKRYNVRKFPPMRVKDIDGFYYWLRSMVWYKHTYFIPDYLIRDTIIATAKEVDDPALTRTVQTSCKKIDKALYSPIKYNLLFKDWRKSNNDERPTDIIREVDEILKLNIHPKSVMVNVQGEIENYLESNHVNALPVMTWIRIFKILFERLSVVMDQIIYYMSPDIKVLKVNEKGLNYEITLNGFEIRHQLYSLKLGSLKQLLDVEGEVPYNDIWDAVSTTYDDNMSRIHVVEPTLKMKQTKGDLCQVCGKIGHELTKCYRAKEAEKRGTILMKNRRVFTPDGTELMISGKETMMRKYPDLFTSAKGRHLYKE